MSTATLVADVAKKRPKKDEPTPPAGESFNLKLPVEYWHGLQAAKLQTGREMTVTSQIALEMYFRAVGVAFTENWPSLVGELCGEFAK
jgi:hypothetical protein